MQLRARSVARSITLAVAVGTAVAAMPGAHAASTAYRCNNGGPVPSHRCTELADALDGTSPNLGALAGPVSISGTGLYTAFSAQPDTGGAQQVYLRHLATGVSSTMSVNGTGTVGNGPSYLPAVSDTAGRVAFISDATNLVALDGNGAGDDVFVRNALTSTTTHLTPSTNPVTGADGQMADLAISGDGSRVAITSLATNLVSGDTNDAADVFVVGTDGTGMRIASANAANEQGNSDSYKPALSANGRFLAFGSDATNLVPGDTEGFADVFVKDLQDDTIERVSVTGLGVAGDGDSGDAGVSISDDGRYVAFTTEASNLGAVSGIRAVVVKDRQTEAVTAITASASQPAEFPVISGDGSIVAFVSDAINLVAGDTNGARDLFLAGRTGGIIRVVDDVAGTGAQTQIPSGSQGVPWGLSNDGTIAAFTTSSALVANDDNATTDLYVHIADLRGPTISAPAANLVTNDPTPAVNATLQTGGNTLEISEGGTVLTTLTAPASGIVATELTGLAEGSHTLSFREVDGPYGSDPVTRTFEIDTVAPSDVTIVAPSDGAVIGNAQPVITGTAGIATGDDSTIDLTITGPGGYSVSSTVNVAGDGSWSHLPSALPSNGTYTISVSQADAAGNSSSDTTSFTLNAGVPTIAITSPVSGATNVSPVTITGSIADATTLTLTVLKDGQPHLSRSVTASGTGWSTTLTPPSDATYTISASATNVGGTGTSNTVNLVFDATVPAAPVITAPLGAIASATPMATGNAEPGATMRLVLDGSPLTPPPVSSPAGAWGFQLPVLAQGAHTLTVRAEDAAGNLSQQVSAAFTVDTQTPAAPVILSPASGSAFRHGGVAISGSGEPGATITVREGATTVGTATVGANSTWGMTPTLATGTHTLVARQTDASGQVSPDSNAIIVTVDPSLAVTEISTPVDNATSTSRQVEISGLAKPLGTIQLSLISGATETPLGPPVSVDANGTWVRIVTLDDGSYRLRARETTTNTVAPDRAFRVRSGVPIIVSPVEGAVLRSEFTVSGTAMPKATIMLRDGATELGVTDADAAGAWSIDVRRPDGKRVFIAYATSGASRTPDSTPRTIEVDNVGPNSTITPDGDPMGSLVGVPVRVSGTAGDAHRVTSVSIVYRNTATGQVHYSSAPPCEGCGSSTSVTFSDQPPLLPGLWTATVTAVDQVGNTGLPATTRFLVLP